MNAIILELLKDKLIVLTKEGEFIEIDKISDAVEIGQEIIIDGQKKCKKQISKWVISIAAVVMLAVFIFGDYMKYYKRQGYINISINSNANTDANIVIDYNIYGDCIKISALNKNGDKLVRKINGFKHKPANIVINNIINVAKQEKFIANPEENVILITNTKIHKKIDDLELDDTVKNFVKENKIEAKTILLEANKDEYKKAEQDNTPIDKFLLINEVIKGNSSYKFADLKEKSIKEIINIIDEKENNENRDVKDTGNNVSKDVKPSNDAENKAEVNQEKRITTEEQLRSIEDKNKEKEKKNSEQQTSKYIQNYKKEGKEDSDKEYGKINKTDMNNKAKHEKEDKSKDNKTNNFIKTNKK